MFLATKTHVSYWYQSYETISVMTYESLLNAGVDIIQ